MKVTVLQKPSEFTAENFESNLENALLGVKGDLTGSVKFEGFSRKGWTRIDIQGDDAEILLELVTRDLGLAQTDLARIDPQGTYEGIIHGEVKGNLEVDIGIETPKLVNVRISPHALRAQLADGKLLPTGQILRDYCLHPGAKLAVRLTRVDSDTGSIDAWLADSQIERFSSWISAYMDRIQISDCYRRDIEIATKKSGIERDVVSLEPFTLTAHSVVCKLGTDAIGLIPKLGSVLKKRELHPFIPRRIMERCRPW